MKKLKHVAKMLLKKSSYECSPKINIDYKMVKLKRSVICYCSW